MQDNNRQGRVLAASYAQALERLGDNAKLDVISLRLEKKNDRSGIHGPFWLLMREK